MGIEIERKFLVDAVLWEKYKPKTGIRIIQGYLSKSIKKSVRVRIKGNKGFITIKGKINNISRTEFQYEIPKQDAKELLTLFCPKKIDKIRYQVEVNGFIWEVDEFNLPKKGLILAEIELASENEKFTLPNWVTKEVSHLPKYYNSNMI